MLFKDTLGSWFFISGSTGDDLLLLPDPPPPLTAAHLIGVVLHGVCFPGLLVSHPTTERVFIFGGCPKMDLLRLDLLCGPVAACPHERGGR